MSKHTISLTFLLLMVCVYCISPQTIFAAESIKSFDVVVTAQKDGVMNVSEKIVYDFGYSSRHGIYRFIPTVATVGNLYRSIKIDFTNILRGGLSEPYDVDDSGLQISAKIGNAKKTITGSHEYTISYNVENGIGSNYEDHDEIYWNVTGNEWNVPIESASIIISTDFGAKIEESICFTGAQSSTESNCLVEQLGNTYKISTTQPLSTNEGLTVVSRFSVNTFPKSILQKNKPNDPDVEKIFSIYSAIFVVSNLITAPALLIWYFTKKRKKRFGKVVVNFDFPQDTQKNRIAPAQTGTIDNTKLDQNDIVATLFDLAIRKYISIKEIKTKGKILGLGTSHDHELTKLKDFNDLSDFEKALMDDIFAEAKTVLLKDVSISYTGFTKLEEENFKYLVDKNIYTKNPKAQMGGLLTLGIISFFFGQIILGPVLIFLSRKLNGRTQIGDELDYKIDGLKMFLKATNRYHTWQAKNLLFLEKMIPYAIALGLINQFMKQLKIAHPEYSPTWYRGNNFLTSYHMFSSSMNSHITTSAPSSSSGFSSGYSGGGGGGGGGGSW